MKVLLILYFNVCQIYTKLLVSIFSFSLQFVILMSKIEQILLFVRTQLRLLKCIFHYNKNFIFFIHIVHISTKYSAQCYKKQLSKACLLLWDPYSFHSEKGKFYKKTVYLTCCNMST